MLSCKDFLKELSEYLDESTTPANRAELDQHLKGCPDCWVVADTTKKTIQIYRGTEAREVPATLRFRLLAALELRRKARHKIQ